MAKYRNGSLAVFGLGENLACSRKFRKRPEAALSRRFNMSKTSLGVK